MHVQGWEPRDDCFSVALSGILSFVHALVVTQSISIALAVPRNLSGG